MVTRAPIWLYQRYCYNRATPWSSQRACSAFKAQIKHSALAAEVPILTTLVHQNSAPSATREYYIPM